MEIKESFLLNIEMESELSSENPDLKTDSDAGIQVTFTVCSVQLTGNFDSVKCSHLSP